MELDKLLNRITRCSLIGVGLLLLLLPWVDRRAEIWSFVFGLGVSVGSGWLYYWMLNKVEGDNVDRSIRVMRSGSTLRLFLAIVALLVAYRYPPLDLISTALGLLIVPILTYFYLLGLGLWSEWKK